MINVTFNSRLPAELYKVIKVEAVTKGINVRDHISNILKEYAEAKLIQEVQNVPEQH